MAHAARGTRAEDSRTKPIQDDEVQRNILYRSVWIHLYALLTGMGLTIVVYILQV